jgi:PASTA domain
MRRVLYDPDPITGIDRSLRAYINAISYGAAILDAKLFPHAFSNGPSVIEAAWQSLPAGHDCSYVLCVIPWADGDPNRIGFFETVGQNGVVAVSRVAMFEIPAIQQPQPAGVWGMEVLHARAGWPDLYKAQGSKMANFDNMCYVGGMHSCAHLKLSPGWLAPTDVVDHRGGQQNYQLHSIGLSAPPAGRFAAVRIRSATTGNVFLAEARLKSDVYERGFAQLKDGNMEFVGLPGEGVIVYQTHDNLQETYFTAGPLGVGQSSSIVGEGFSVNATGRLDGGLTIQVAGGLQLAIVPDVIGLTGTRAGQLIVAAGLKVHISNPTQPPPNWVVVSQNPKGGVVTSHGNTVNITLHAGSPQ